MVAKLPSAVNRGVHPLPLRPAVLPKREGAVVAARGGDVPDALVHGGDLVVADDVAALDVVLVLGALVGDVVDEDDAVAGFGIEDDVLLGLAPGLEFGAVVGFEVGRLDLVAVLDELEVREVGAVVLEVEGGVDADRLDGVAGAAELALLLPVAVEVEMPLLQVGPRVDVGAEAAQLALAAHHAFEDGADAGVADEGRVGLRLAVEQRIEPHVADGVEPLLPAHCAGVVDALAHVLGLLGRERVLDEDKAVLFEPVQFGFEVVHSASPCGAGSGAGAGGVQVSLTSRKPSRRALMSHAKPNNPFHRGVVDSYGFMRGPEKERKRDQA